MRTLVTGGAGFIGSALVDRLLAEGHAVDVVDDLSGGTLANLSAARADHEHQLTFHHHDIRSPSTIELMRRRHPEVVFHLAAHNNAEASVLNPVLDAEVNVIGSLQVLEGARGCGARKVVFASSGSSLYASARPRDLPIKESYPQRPVSPGGVAKKVVGDYLIAYRELHALEFSALALGNVYGPRQKPTGEGGIVAAFAQSLLNGQPCLVAGSGEQTRDFVYVDDAVDAFARAAQRGSGLLLNIATGVETSLSQLYRTMAAQAGVEETTFRPGWSGYPEPGEPARWALDPGRAGIHLGWKPWTSLAEGTRAVIDWLAGRGGQAQRRGGQTQVRRSRPL